MAAGCEVRASQSPGCSPLEVCKGAAEMFSFQVSFNVMRMKYGGDTKRNQVLTPSEEVPKQSMYNTWSNELINDLNF